MNVSAPIFALWAILGAAALWDWSQRRIPNVLIGGGLLIGLAYQAQFGLSGLGFAASGFLVMFAALILPFSAGWMGGGDVKLMLVAGVFLGWAGVLWLLLAAVLINGVVSAAFLGARELGKRIGRPLKEERVPAAIAILLASLALQGFLPPLPGVSAP